MGQLIAVAHESAIDIGGMPILVRTDSADFARMLENRYGSFVNPTGPRPVFELEIDGCGRRPILIPSIVCCAFCIR